MENITHPLTSEGGDLPAQGQTPTQASSAIKVDLALNDLSINNTNDENTNTKITATSVTRPSARINWADYEHELDEEDDVHFAYNWHAPKNYSWDEIDLDLFLTYNPDSFKDIIAFANAHRYGQRVAINNFTAKNRDIINRKMQSIISFVQGAQVVLNRTTFENFHYCVVKSNVPEWDDYVPATCALISKNRNEGDTFGLSRDPLQTKINASVVVDKQLGLNDYSEKSLAKKKQATIAANTQVVELLVDDVREPKAPKKQSEKRKKQSGKSRDIDPEYVERIDSDETLSEDEGEERVFRKPRTPYDRLRDSRIPGARTRTDPHHKPRNFNPHGAPVTLIRRVGDPVPSQEVARLHRRQMLFYCTFFVRPPVNYVKERMHPNQPEEKVFFGAYLPYDVPLGFICFKIKAGCCGFKADTYAYVPGSHKVSDDGKPFTAPLELMLIDPTRDTSCEAWKWHEWFSLMAKGKDGQYYHRANPPGWHINTRHEDNITNGFEWKKFKAWWRVPIEFQRGNTFNQRGISHKVNEPCAKAGDQARELFDSQFDFEEGVQVPGAIILYPHSPMTLQKVCPPLMKNILSKVTMNESITIQAADPVKIGGRVIIQSLATGAIGYSCTNGTTAVDWDPSLEGMVALLDDVVAEPLRHQVRIYKLLSTDAGNGMLKMHGFEPSSPIKCGFVHFAYEFENFLYHCFVPISHMKPIEPAHVVSASPYLSCINRIVRGYSLPKVVLDKLADHLAKQFAKDFNRAEQRTLGLSSVINRQQTSYSRLYNSETQGFIRASLTSLSFLNEWHDQRVNWGTIAKASAVTTVSLMCWWYFRPVKSGPDNGVLCAVSGVGPSEVFSKIGSALQERAGFLTEEAALLTTSYATGVSYSWLKFGFSVLELAKNWWSTSFVSGLPPFTAHVFSIAPGSPIISAAIHGVYNEYAKENSLKKGTNLKLCLMTCAVVGTASVVIWGFKQRDPTYEEMAQRSISDVFDQYSPQMDTRSSSVTFMKVSSQSKDEKKVDEVVAKEVGVNTDPSPAQVPIAAKKTTESPVGVGSPKPVTAPPPVEVQAPVVNNVQPIDVVPKVDPPKVVQKQPPVEQPKPAVVTPPVNATPPPPPQVATNSVLNNNKTQGQLRAEAIAEQERKERALALQQEKERNEAKKLLNAVGVVVKLKETVPAPDNTNQSLPSSVVSLPPAKAKTEDVIQATPFKSIKGHMCIPSAGVSLPWRIPSQDQMSDLGVTIRLAVAPEFLSRMDQSQQFGFSESSLYFIMGGDINKLPFHYNASLINSIGAAANRLVPSVVLGSCLPSKPQIVIHTILHDLFAQARRSYDAVEARNVWLASRSKKQMSKYEEKGLLKLSLDELHQKINRDWTSRCFVKEEPTHKISIRAIFQIDPVLEMACSPFVFFLENLVRDAMKKADLNFCFTGGMNALEKGEFFAKKLANKPHFYCVDATSWDTNVPGRYLKQVRDNYFNPDLYKIMSHPTRYQFGPRSKNWQLTLTKSPDLDSMLSGSPDTYLCNSIVNHSILSEFMDTQHPNVGYSIMICGDDSVLATDTEINITDLRKWYALHHLEIETAHYTDPRDVDFCSGNFVQLPNGSYVWIPFIHKFMSKAFVLKNADGYDTNKFINDLVHTIYHNYKYVEGLPEKLVPPQYVNRLKHIKDGYYIPSSFERIYIWAGDCTLYKGGKAPLNSVDRLYPGFTNCAVYFPGEHIGVYTTAVCEIFDKCRFAMSANEIYAKICKKLEGENSYGLLQELLGFNGRYPFDPLLSHCIAEGTIPALLDAREKLERQHNTAAQFSRDFTVQVLDAHMANNRNNVDYYVRAFMVHDRPISFKYLKDCKLVRNPDLSPYETSTRRIMTIGIDAVRKTTMKTNKPGPQRSVFLDPQFTNTPQESVDVIAAEEKRREDEAKLAYEQYAKLEAQRNQPIEAPNSAVPQPAPVPLQSAYVHPTYVRTPPHIDQEEFDAIRNLCEHERVCFDQVPEGWDINFDYLGNFDVGKYEDNDRNLDLQAMENMLQVLGKRNFIILLNHLIVQDYTDDIRSPDFAV